MNHKRQLVPNEDGLKEGFPEALAAYREGNLKQAFALLDRLLSVEPSHPSALHLMGVLALAHERPEDALVLFDAALQCGGAADASVHTNRGSALHQMGRFELALQAYEQAIALEPSNAHAWYNRANTLKSLQRLELARDSFERCASLMPTFRDAHHNWGTTLHDLGRFDEAVICFDRALHLDPTDAQARKNRAIALLMTGRFKQGWQDYEARWLTEPLVQTRTDRGCPQWTGQEPLVGRSVLLHAEQGLGDTLQFCRYATIVKRLGAAHVVLEAPRALLHVLQGLNGVDLLVPAGLPLPTYDFHIPLMSLPGALGTEAHSIPAEVPYLHADPELAKRWSFPVDSGIFRIGVCWQGSAKGIEVGRSMPLKAFAPLARLPGVRLYSLQKGGHEGEVADPGLGFAVESFNTLDAEIPFGDTAALMTHLDLVITADTSVAHLAGALGVPVWVALPLVCDWRWRDQGSTTPWYPSMRLFRQQRSGEWAGCFEAMANALLDGPMRG